MDPIRSIYEDDPDMLEIVREFAAELPDRIAELESNLETGRLRELQTMAHQLKGAGGGYGFQPISDTAGELEAAIKDSGAAAVVKDKLGLLCEVLAAITVPEAS